MLVDSQALTTTCSSGDDGDGRRALINPSPGADGIHLDDLTRPRTADELWALVGEPLQVRAPGGSNDPTTLAR